MQMVLPRAKLSVMKKTMLLARILEDAFFGTPAGSGKLFGVSATVCERDMRKGGEIMQDRMIVTKSPSA
jgi:hypothetical protein